MGKIIRIRISLALQRWDMGGYRIRPYSNIAKKMYKTSTTISASFREDRVVLPYKHALTE